MECNEYAYLFGGWLSTPVPQKQNPFSLTSTLVMIVIALLTDLTKYFIIWLKCIFPLLMPPQKAKRVAVGEWFSEKPKRGGQQA